MSFRRSVDSSEAGCWILVIALKEAFTSFSKQSVGKVVGTWFGLRCVETVEGFLQRVQDAGMEKQPSFYALPH